MMQICTHQPTIQNNTKNKSIEFSKFQRDHPTSTTQVKKSGEARILQKDEKWTTYSYALALGGFLEIAAASNATAFSVTTSDAVAFAVFDRFSSAEYFASVSMSRGPYL